MSSIQTDTIQDTAVAASNEKQEKVKSPAWQQALEAASGKIDESATVKENYDSIVGTIDENTSQEQMRELEEQIRYRVLRTLMKKGDDETDQNIRSQFETDFILYDVPQGVEAAEVAPYWNADNTSSRLVDFAMSFRQYFGHLSDVEYMEEIQAAMLEGFARAKESMGNPPGDLGALYNDTYRMTMNKLDALTDEAKEKEANQAELSEKEEIVKEVLTEKLEEDS